MAVSKNARDFWLDHSAVYAWESVALSLDIDPDTITQTSDGYPAVRTLPIEHREEFDKRQRLLSNVLASGPQHFTGVVPSSIHPVFHRVRLLEVVTWLSSRGRTSPDWLQAAIETAGIDEPDLDRESHWVDTHESTAIDLDGVRFDEFNEETAAVDPAGPLARQRWQEDDIIRVIKALGHNAMALPKNEPGKKGIRFQVRTQCAADNPSKWIGSAVFKHAWNRLSEQSRIKYSE